LYCVFFFFLNTKHVKTRFLKKIAQQEVGIDLNIAPPVKQEDVIDLNIVQVAQPDELDKAMLLM
jgi:type II secretory pathway component GspD/PulD (secretin)